MDLARPDEIPALGNIVERVFHEYGWVFRLEDELPDFVNFHGYYGLNAMKAGRPRLFTIRLDGERICGVIALKYNHEGACLSRVYLDEDVRGKGVGRWMIQHVLDLAESEGVDQVHLWTDTQFLGAHRLYKRLGFEMTSLLKPLHDQNRCFEWKMVRML